MHKKLVLIDGNSILNRAFYGVPDLTNGEGTHTNAVYGFLNILFKILEEEQAELLMVAFDVKAPTFRHKLYEAYKGTRKPMPEELREQLPIMKEVLQAMGVTIMEQAGLEADDILGTMAKRGEAAGYEVSLVSGDRDLLQVATEHIKIRIPKTKGSRTEIEDYYAKDVLEKYQVTPVQFIELKALMGDTADNIPGVPKVGEKTATELMTTYGSMENIYANLDQITKKSIKASLEAHKDLADLSKVLATIEVNADINYGFEDAKIGDLYTQEAYEWFQKLEFKNLLKRFTDKETTGNTQIAFFRKVTELDQVEAVFAGAKKASRVSFSILEDSGKAEDFCGLTLCTGEEEVYYLEAQGFVTKDYLLGKLLDMAQAIQQEKSAVLAGFSLKKDYGAIKPESVEGLYDVQLAAYLLNPLKNDYEIEDIAREHLGLMIPARGEALGKDTYIKAAAEKEQALFQYACYYAYVIWKAVPVLQEKLKETGMEQLFYEMEMPLTLVLYEMEQNGMKIQRSELKNYGDALVDRIQELEKAIHQAAGVDFNINSPKQLGEVLFEAMKIPGGKKTKTGYSTAAEVLEKLSAEYQIVADVLEYRGLAKLKSTYADGLGNCIAADERIHSTFNQTITATGRISSTEPNLQNIPMRMELGRLIRKVFIPEDGCVFMDADYSQIELRILAHMSGDEQLIEAYKQEQDIHRITASQVFHIPFDEVTDLQRRNAKAVNFGIVYGISSFGLSQDLSITRKEAASYIEQYFATYPSVKIFLDKLVEDAREQGYVTTMFGRRRPVPELKSSNFMQRSFGERVAMNSPIQGTAADIIKIAMIRVWEQMRKQGLQSRLILQVHDELLIETREEEVEQVRAILTKEMKAAADLAVTLEIDLHTGYNWYEAK
ncbi:MAG: DNA polymerase I [Lachnospiraceae bacterium]|nr:DNA polymerase I [Lachnospiraceae bacterium]